MTPRPGRRTLPRHRQFGAGLAVALIVAAWWSLSVAGRGLVDRRMTADGLPMRYLAPVGPGPRPGVVLAHGFAGSHQLMLGYGLTLAQAGYGVMLLDFEGHAANPRPLDPDEDGLQRDLQRATEALTRQPGIDPARIGLLGHSMGSGAVMAAAITMPERYQATVAVSPTGAAVTVAAPRNLLLMAGALEPPFVANARALLHAAGGPNADLSGGRGRELVVIPWVEHISILFSPAAHRTALDWFNSVLRHPAGPVFQDRRLLWYGIHLAAWMTLALSLAPLWRAPVTARAAPDPGSFRRIWRRLGLPLGALLGVVLLTLTQERLPLERLGGMLVGGGFALWLGVAGLVWLLPGFRPDWPTRRSLLMAVGLFLLLWLAYGWIAQAVWLPWRLIPARLIRWPWLALALLPLNLAAGLAQAGQGWRTRLLWWLAQSLCLVGAGLLLAFLVPGLGFLIIVLPTLPLLLLVMTIAGGIADDAWAYGLSQAMFLAWNLALLFPLVR